MNYEVLKKMLDIIFENPEVTNANFSFYPYIEISEAEFKELIGVGEPLQEVDNGGLILDEYEYWEFENQYLKLQLEYYRENEKIYLMKANFWREIKS